MNLIANLFGNTLYYSGCMYKYVLKDENARYKEILKEAGVDFIVIPEEFCCGSPVLKAGYKKDFEKLKEQNLKIFKSLSVKEVITACPACRLILKEQYGLKARHITEFPALLASLKLKRSGSEWSCIDKDSAGGMGVTTHKAVCLGQKGGCAKLYYHDPCHLGRLGGIYSQPRDLLKKRGYEVLEFKRNRSQSQCCGAGAGVKANFPELSGKIAANVLSELPENAIVTSPCPMCFKHFQEIADIDKGKRVEVIEFSRLL